jgi:serine/threonine protein kinase
MSEDEIQFPSGFGLQDVVGWGTTGLVVLDESSQTIIKTPLDSFAQESIRLISKERQIYERLANRGGHKGILSYHGPFESGIRLEYAPNHALQSFNKKHDVDLRQRLRWAAQIIEAVDFMHKSGVIHGDLTSANIFLDEKLNAKVADFAGSSIDGSPLLIAVTASHEYPGPLLSPQGDLFAFASVLYEIMSGDMPYRGLSDEEICGRYSKGEFPDTEPLPTAIGSVIRKCWQGKYNSCEEAIDDLRDESSSGSKWNGTIVIIDIGQHI